MKFQALIEGLLTFLPGCSNLLTKKTRGTDSARYCYSVWLRHYIKTHPYRNNYDFDVIVELGPGDSLGIGLSALFTGARKYIAVDSVKHAAIERNLRVLDELAVLFSRRSPIPEGNEFPEVKPYLENYEFPAWLSEPTLAAFNQTKRNLSQALRNPSSPDGMIAYHSPEWAGENIAENSVDFIYSQAVLEHVDHLDWIYEHCYRWLAPGGLMSHQIDFKSHGMSLEWNGHWAYSSFMWRMIKGRRPYLINREPCSTHLRLMQKAGFEIVSIERHRQASSLKRSHLAREFRYLEDDDLSTSGVYVVARKPPPCSTRTTANLPPPIKGELSCAE